MRAALLAAALSVAAASASAAVTISAELSRTHAALDDQIALSVTVAGDQASLPEPELPPLRDFSLYESGRSQNVGFVNGQVSASVTHTYVLVPRALGRLRVPPIRAPGAASPTPPLEVEVVQPGARAAGAAAPDEPPAAGAAPGPAGRGRRPDLFLEALLDKTRAYVNEQVTLTVRFCSAAALAGDSRYEAPRTAGFLTEDLPPVRSSRAAIGGRPYQCSEVKTALFPVSAGALTIGPASVRAAVLLPSPAAGPDFFERFFSLVQPRPVTVTSDPATLRVDPLPPGAPEDFTGVVGRLSAEAALDRTRLKAGEAATLTVTVSGTGDVKSVPEPRRPDLPDLRFFQTESAASVDKSGDRVGGRKTFRTVVVPRASGDVRLPPLSFSFFDPERKAYVRAETAPLTLHADPGAPGPAPAAAGPAPGLSTIQDDVRYLKLRPAGAPLSAALAAFAGLGLWHAAPFLALLAAALAAWRRRRADADPRGARFRRARGRAERRLAEAAALPLEQAAQAAALADATLAAFVADKLDAPPAGLTLKSALAGLKALRKPPSDAALRRLAQAWEEADRRRFSPDAPRDARAFAAEVSAAIKTLDEECGL